MFGKFDKNFLLISKSLNQDAVMVIQGASTNFAPVNVLFPHISSYQALSPKPPKPIPNQVQIISKTKLVLRGLRLTLKSCKPPPNKIKIY